MAKEIFNYNSVKAKMDELQVIFDEFADVLNDLNIQVEAKINQNAMSAVFGNAGEIAKKTWDENSASFSSFKANFENWSQLVATVSLNNLTFEANNYRTINGRDKITESELLSELGFSTLIDTDASNNPLNGENVVSENVDSYGDMSEFISGVTSAQVADSTASILDRSEEIPVTSLIQTGESMTLTSGSKVIIGDQEYEVVGFASNNNLGVTMNSGYDGMYMWLSIPGDDYLYCVPANGNGSVTRSNRTRQTFDDVSILSYKSRYSQLMTSNPGWVVTALAAPNDASYFEAVISNEYISKSYDVVNHAGEVVAAIAADKTFVMADGKRVKEHDYNDTVIDSQVFYNPRADFMGNGIVTNTWGDDYWIDSNGDGFVTYEETLNTTDGANNVQRAFEKVKERGNNYKHMSYDGKQLISVVNE